MLHLVNAQSPTLGMPSLVNTTQCIANSVALAIFIGTYQLVNDINVKGKGKASSLDIAPFTVLNSGTLQSR